MMKESIKILRFKLGETIICGLKINNDTGEYLIERPMLISMLPIVGKKGIQSMTIYMQEWLEFSKETHFTITSDVVMLVATPEDEMLEEYLEALEKNDLNRIERDFDKISKNYGEDPEEIDGNSFYSGYNNETYEDRDSEEEEDLDEDDFEKRS